MTQLFKSRTIWLAVAQAVSAIAIAVFTELDMVSIAMLIKSLADILLRVDTDTSVWAK